MIAVSDATRRFSRMRRGILFLLVFALIFMLFGSVLSAPADAASYKVKAWVDGDMSYYYVYQGSLPKDYYKEPTFCRDASDVYTSGKMKISFYHEYYYVSKEKADAFTSYLGNKVKNDSWTTGWYWSGDPASDMFIHAYRIIGWNIEKDSLSKLRKQAPFKNSEGTKLYIDYVGRGDLVSEAWSDYEIWNGDAAIVYWSRFDATIAFRFVH